MSLREDVVSILNSRERGPDADAHNLQVAVRELQEAVVLIASRLDQRVETGLEIFDSAV